MKREAKNVGGDEKSNAAPRLAITYHKFSLASALSFFFDGGVKPFVEVSIIVWRAKFEFFT